MKEKRKISLARSISENCSEPDNITQISESPAQEVSWQVKKVSWQVKKVSWQVKKIRKQVKSRSICLGVRGLES